ncbi:MAG: winged helix-turn-helix domain-containing protein, partial [Nitrospirae bacterium]|nr:winged helix-turn-helix domain-containing protein [Nitrospirota bacterium]
MPEEIIRQTFPFLLQSRQTLSAGIPGFLPCKKARITSINQSISKFIFFLTVRSGNDSMGHVKLSVNSVGRLLAQMGITCQKPLYRAIERNEGLVQKWLKKEYPKIK